MCAVLCAALCLCVCGCGKTVDDGVSSTVIIDEQIIYEDGTPYLSEENTDTSNNGNPEFDRSGNTKPSESDSKPQSDDPSNDTQNQDVLSLADAAVTSKIKTNGRCEKSADGIRLNFSASAIEFETDAAGAVLEIDANAGVYYSVIVDGVITQKRAVAEGGRSYVVLARNLPEGKHNIKFIRETEGRFNTRLTAVSLQLDGGDLADRPSDSKPLIEFLGDSLTSGYGNLVSNTITKASDLKYQSSLEAYPYITASKLGVDYRIVSMSGIAVKSRDSYPAFLDFYKCENYFEDKTRSYSSSNPADVDIVIVNLGTNDVSHKLFNTENADSVEDYSNEYAKIITDIGYSKQASIVFVSGCGSCEKQSVAFVGAIKKLEAQGYSKVYSYNASKNRSGGENHPSAQEHQNIANEIIKFLKEKGII